MDAVWKSKTNHTAGSFRTKKNHMGPSIERFSFWHDWTLICTCGAVDFIFQKAWQSWPCPVCDSNAKLPLASSKLYVSTNSRVQSFFVFPSTHKLKFGRKQITCIIYDSDMVGGSRRRGRSLWLSFSIVFNIFGYLPLLPEQFGILNDSYI